MLKNLTTYFLLLGLCIAPSVHASSSPLLLTTQSTCTTTDTIEASCMSLWTKIDLARAITLTDEQQLLFMNDLVNEVIELYCLIKNFTEIKQRAVGQQEFIAALRSSIQTIQQSIPEVFEAITTPCAVTAQFLLEKIAILLTDY
jgi:hypothetical protein